MLTIILLSKSYFNKKISLFLSLHLFTDQHLIDSSHSLSVCFSSFTNTEFIHSSHSFSASHMCTLERIPSLIQMQRTHAEGHIICGRKDKSMFSSLSVNHYMDYNCQDCKILNDGHLQKKMLHHTLDEVQVMFQNLLGSLSPQSAYRRLFNQSTVYFHPITVYFHQVTV